MKKNLLIVSGLLFITTSLLAQGPTFSSSFNPYPGFTAIVQEAKISGLQPGNIGASESWDFSNLQDTSASPVTTTYVDPDNTPYLNEFPGANLAFRTSGGFIHYQETSSSGFVNLGQADSGQWYFDFTKPLEIWQYPLSYNTVQTSTFNGSFSTDGYTDDETGTDTLDADGYGTLKMPGGKTIDNVLRVNSIIYYNDVYTGSVSATYITIYNYVYYITPGYQNPLITITNGVQYKNGSFYSSFSTVDYATNASAGINDINPLVENLNVFPNPSQSQSTLALTLKAGANINAYITNIIGQRVRTIVIKQADAGDYTYSIETSNMAKGLYLVNVEINGAIAGIRKLEIE